MNAFINFLVTCALIVAVSSVLFATYRWALENFNLGRIQLQDLSSRRQGYTAVDEERAEGTDAAGFTDLE